MASLLNSAAPILSAASNGTPDNPRDKEPPASPTRTKSSRENLRVFTDMSLKFLANANNETLAACALGLCAATYLILGRIGLVLIGAVGGVVLHATWEASNNADGELGGSERAANRKRELGLEVAKRVLDWRERRTSADKDEQIEDTKVEASVSAARLDYNGFRPATSAALTTLTDAIIRDYVKWWYGPILPSESTFPLASRQILISFILSISNHLARKRPADLFLDFVSNSTSIIIVFLNELSTALRAEYTLSPDAAISSYLENAPDSNLANVLSTTQQERKLGLVAEDVLANFLDSKAYNFPPSKAFLREIFSGVVLESTIKTCSKPEWINEWIVYLLEDGDPEIMNAIDAGVKNTSTDAHAPGEAAGQTETKKRHARRVSRAEQAMEEAMLEAKRMNEMIAEEEARRKKEFSSIAEIEDTASTATTEGIATPMSSDSELNRAYERPPVTAMIQSLSKEEILPQGPEPRDLPETSSFIDFDQILPTQTFDNSKAMDPGILTLHNAHVSILDDGDPGTKTAFRTKPIFELLLQIEPANSKFSGWMIVRKYEDFERLHEVLRRISVISGIPEFADKHANVPTWKGQTKTYLGENLEKYLQDALKYLPLAENGGMKKFLEKDTGLAKVPAANKNIFLQGPAALESMGKGFANVLGQAPKGLAGGGKAVLGGVQGVFGAVGGSSKKALPRMPLPEKSPSTASLQMRESQDSRRSYDSGRIESSPTELRHSRPTSTRQSTETSNIGFHGSAENKASLSLEGISLPPPPGDIPDDYVEPTNGTSTAKKASLTAPKTSEEGEISQSQSSTDFSQRTPSRTDTSKSSSQQAPPPQNDTTSTTKPTPPPLTEEETKVSIDLVFAIITELFSLSSAWSIRLSLLAAAKTILLRPNNPQLDSIRLLLQDSVIDANSSDVGLAEHLLKLRVNTLPTEEELKGWPAEKSESEKEKLRVKARKLLVERGMPQALTSVMGSAASGEALGKVFDCLQVEKVARGLIFALLLQALRAATQ